MTTQVKPSTDTATLLDPAWHELSVVSFNGVRSVTTLVRQWWLLVATYNEIIRFARSMGLNTHLPEFDNAHFLVEWVIALWKTRVPNGAWGALKQARMAAWTNDPKNGWLAMMHKRMRELHYPQHAANAIDSSGSPPPRLATPVNRLGGNQAELGQGFPSLFATAPVPVATADSTDSTNPADSIDPTDLTNSTDLSGDDVAPGQVEATEQAQPDQPHNLGQQDRGSPSTHSHTRERATDDSGVTAQDFAGTWGMTHGEGMTNGKPLATSHAKADHVNPPACVDTLGWAVVQEREERQYRLGIALDLMNKDGLRESAQGWIKTSFLASNPSQDFAQFLGHVQRELGLAHSTANQAPPLSMPPMPLMPSMDLPDSLGLINPTFPMPQTPQVPPMTLLP